MAHRVMPYYVREVQPWAIEQERRRHNEALWYLGENAFFCLMWHLEDHTAGLVGRCPTCYESQGAVGDVYGQPDQHRCPDCFGTTFEGGFKAIIVRPAIFTDSDESENHQARGVTVPQGLTIESTPDFRIRSGDYCFRINGDRFFLRAPERITLRTGFAYPGQEQTAIGYNHARAAQEDLSSVAHMIPPQSDEVALILARMSRIPRDWGTFEILRGPLIPHEDFVPSLEWTTPMTSQGDGLPGPPGPPGPSGGSYVHDQMTASMVWTITHGLDYQPAGVRVVDSAGAEQEGLVSYPTEGVVRIDFAVPFAGKAYLS